MRPDPPLPADGTCAQCGGPRDRKAKGALHRREPAIDPFCSSACCRVWHEAPLSGGQGRGTTDYKAEWRDEAAAAGG